MKGFSQNAAEMLLTDSYGKNSSLAGLMVHVRWCPGEYFFTSEFCRASGGLWGLSSTPGTYSPLGEQEAKQTLLRCMENTLLAPGMGSDILLCTSWWQKWANQVLLCSCWNYFMFREPAGVGLPWLDARPPPSCSFTLIAQQGRGWKEGGKAHVLR